MAAYDKIQKLGHSVDGVSPAPFAGVTITDTDGAAKTIPIVSSGAPPQSSLAAAAANGNGTAINFGRVVNSVSMQTVLTGSPSGGTITLQGSLDGTNWGTLATFTIGTDTSGAFKVASNTPVQYARAVLAGLTGGTSPTVTANIAGY